MHEFLFTGPLVNNLNAHNLGLELKLRSLGVNHDGTDLFDAF